MPGFPVFRETHGSNRILAPPVTDERTLVRYRDRLPSSLLEEWRISGWAGFQQGFLWLTDPSVLEPGVRPWKLERPALCFGRTAFGDLFLWDGGAVQGLFVHEGSLQRMTDSFDMFFELSLCDDDFLEDVLDKAMFEDALERLGPLTSGEMYTFVPAPALGGEKSVDSLQKVKMREQLLLLSQLHAK